MTRSGKRYISVQLLISRYVLFLVVGPTFGQNRFSILCVSMDHQLTPRVGAASFHLSHGLLRLLERELFIIYLQNTERDAIKLYGALYVIHQFRVNLGSIRRFFKVNVIKYSRWFNSQ